MDRFDIEDGRLYVTADPADREDGLKAIYTGFGIVAAMIAWMVLLVFGTNEEFK